MTLIDSGADESFIDSRVCQQLGIKTEPLDVQLDTKALNGILLARVDRRTIPIPLLLSGNHQEKIRFHVIDCPHIPLLLGFPWLKLHNPHFDWTTGKIRSWSPHCHSHCLRSAQTPTSEQPPVAEPPDLSSVPRAYHDLAPVFSRFSLFLPIGHMTAPLSFCLGPLIPAADCTTSIVHCSWPWRSRFRSP